MIRALLLALILTGCAHTGPVADGLTTTVGLQMGATEGNPLIAANPTVALPLSVAVRIGAMRYARGSEHCEQIANTTDSIGWAAAINNIGVVAGCGVVAAPIGILAGIVLYHRRKQHFVEYCRVTCSLDDLPDFATRATCERGRIVSL